MYRLSHLPHIRQLKMAALATLMSLAATTTALAQSPLIIVDARVDSATNTVRLDGANFGTAPPTVTLGAYTTPLAIVSASSNQVVATLPAGVAPGTYLLTLTATTPNGNRPYTAADEFWLAIGAQGAAGPPGPPGVTGYQNQTSEVDVLLPAGLTQVSGNACPGGFKLLSGAAFAGIVDSVGGGGFTLNRSVFLSGTEYRLLSGTTQLGFFSYVTNSDAVAHAVRVRTSLLCAQIQ